MHIERAVCCVVRGATTDETFDATCLSPYLAVHRVVAAEGDAREVRDATHAATRIANRDAVSRIVRDSVPWGIQ